MDAMSVVKINAITVPGGGGDEVPQRFAKGAGAVDNQPGFEEFQLLRPADDRNTWLVYTRWKDEESFQAWAPRSNTGTSRQKGQRSRLRPAASCGSSPSSSTPEGEQTHEHD